MYWSLTPQKIVVSLIIGSLAAYLAHRRKQNPYLGFALGALFGLFGMFALFFAPLPRKKRAQSKPKQPIFTIRGPTDKLWYYLDASHQQQGPMSHHALTRNWKEGKIDPTTYVWHEEIPDWVPLQQVLETK